ncbi:MAG: hypothetical protein KAS90_00565 [Candidatus Aenigmarchaeota archaeon]|nr:hypothetical protein [Candidatus Aenigmarchaeota archaeon]
MPEPTLIEERNIETEDEKFFKHILITLPLSPQYARFRVVPQDIPDCNMEKNMIKKYLKQCEKNDTIPFSKTEVEYDNDLKIFIPGSIDIENNVSRLKYDDEKSYLKIIESTIEQQLSGGKPHTVHIEIGIPAEDGFKSFGQAFYDELLNKGYVIEYGDIWLTSKHSNQHYDKGHGPVSTMTLSMKDSKYSLNLHLKKNDTEIYNTDINGWFANLKEIYKND